MAFATVPTPLWPLYQVRDHFGPTSVTIAFAAMVVGAAATFPTLGHLSDHIGRRAEHRGGGTCARVVVRDRWPAMSRRTWTGTPRRPSK